MSEIQSSDAPAEGAESAEVSEGSEGSELSASGGEVSEGGEGEDISGAIDAGLEAEGADGEKKEAKAEIKELKDLKKKLKLKVNGKDVEEEIDFNDDEGLTKRMQKARAFDEKAQELAQLRREVGDLVKVLQDSPDEVLKQFGVDPEKWAYELLQKKVEEAKKSPEQREREKEQAELKKYKEERDNYEKQIKEQQESQRRDVQAKSIQDSIVQSLSKHEGVLDINDPYAIAEIASAMKEVVQLAIKDPKNYGHLADVTPEQVIPMVEERMQAKLQARLAKLLDSKNSKAVEKLLGKSTLEKLRQERLQAAKPKVNKPKISETGESSRLEEQNRAEAKVRSKDFFKNLGKS
jgi:hypothetical protein